MVHFIDSAAVTQELSRLINQGHFHQALKLGRAYLDEHQGAADADTIFQVFLASILTGKRDTQIESLLQSSKGYSSVMHGDVLRDIALACIRQGRPQEALDVLDEIAKLHKDDGNRLALIPMVEGRAQLALDNPEDAVKYHLEATRLFASLTNEPLNWQWFMNNEFHYLRALAACGRRDKETYRLFLSKELSRTRRIRARALYRFGRTGYRLDRRIEARLA